MGNMHQGLPLVVSIELVGFGSSEFGFGTSFNSMILVGLHVVHSRTSGSRSGLRYLPSSLSALRVAHSPAWAAIHAYRQLTTLLLYAMQ